MRVDKTKWIKKTFPQIGSSHLGKTLDSNKNTGKPYPYLCAANVGYGEFNLSNTKEILLEENELERYAVKYGDLLICEGGDTGRCAIWKSDKPIYYQNALHRVRCNDDIYNKFIMYSIHYYKKVGIIDKLSHGRTIKHFTQKGLNRLNFYIPQYNIQQAIASELDAIQTMIDGYKAQLADLDTLAQSIFLDMFGDPVANPKGWDKHILNEICDVRDGTHDSPKYIENGIPLITSKNIVDGKIDFSDTKNISISDADAINKRSKVDNGDIIMPMIGAIGSPIIVEEIKPFCIKNVALIKFNNANVINIYIKHLLSSSSFDEYMHKINKGVAQKFISLKVIRNFNIPLPSLSLQQQFAHRIEAIEKQKELIKSQLADAETLMAERMQYYFS